MSFFFLEGVFLGLGIYLIEKNDFLSVILLSLILFISLYYFYILLDKRYNTGR